MGLLSDGWVGIGTSLPAAPLHVMGNVIVEGGSVQTGSVQANSVSAGTFQGDGALLTNLRPSNIVGLIQSSNIAGLFAWQEVTGTSRQAVPNSGYVANNAARVTITLPVAPAFGEVVRAAGLGTGGWKIAQNAGQFISVENVQSFDSGWTAHETNRNWKAVASSADGTRLVAVDVFGYAGGNIYVSGDSGVTWVSRGSSYPWSGVASSADGSKLVAVIAAGLIFSSPDYGVSWTPCGITMDWSDVASS